MSNTVTLNAKNGSFRGTPSSDLKILRNHQSQSRNKALNATLDSSVMRGMRPGMSGALIPGMQPEDSKIFNRKHLIGLTKDRNKSL
jgi:hypothetical protein